MEERTPRTIKPALAAVQWDHGGGLAVALGLLIAVREKNLPLGFDTEWMEEIVEHRDPLWEAPSLAMNFLGGGWFAVFVVPLVVIALLLAVRRYAAAVYFAVAVLLSVGIVQLLKQTLGRPRPLDILVVSDPASFPSGHVANAATLAVVHRHHRATRLGLGGRDRLHDPDDAQSHLSRGTLGRRPIGGALVGVGVAVIVWAPLARRLERER